MLKLDVSVEVVLDAQVLHEMLRFAQIPHFDIKVVASSQERWTWVLNETSTGNGVDYLWVCIRKWLDILDLALDCSFHFCRLSQVINLNQAFRRGKKKLAGLCRVELAVIDDFIDNDGDGADDDDMTEGILDTDGDGIPDYLDND